MTIRPVHLANTGVGGWRGYVWGWGGCAWGHPRENLRPTEIMFCTWRVMKTPPARARPALKPTRIATPAAYPATDPNPSW